MTIHNSAFYLHYGISNTLANLPCSISFYKISKAEDVTVDLRLNSKIDNSFTLAENGKNNLGYKLFTNLKDLLKFEKKFVRTIWSLKDSELKLSNGKLIKIEKIYNINDINYWYETSKEFKENAPKLLDTNKVVLLQNLSKVVTHVLCNYKGKFYIIELKSSFIN